MRRFSVTDTAAGMHRVTQVTALSDTSFEVTFDPPVVVKEWTTIRADVEDLCGNRISNLGDLGPGVDEPDRIDIGFLPGDIDENGIVQPIVTFRQACMNPSE